MCVCVGCFVVHLCVFVCLCVCAYIPDFCKSLWIYLHGAENKFDLIQIKMGGVGVA